MDIDDLLDSMNRISEATYTFMISTNLIIHTLCNGDRCEK